jgi:urocanate hydratase
MRMLVNKLDAEVAESPEELVVYGGIGRAARDRESFDRIVASLRALESNETLLVQSGKSVGIFRTPADPPRVLMGQFQSRAALGHLGSFQRARSEGTHDVRPDDGRLVDPKASKGIVQGTYETFAEARHRHDGFDLSGR